MARPFALTPAQRHIVHVFLEIGMPRKELADIYGVSVDVIDREAARPCPLCENHPAINTLTNHG